MRMQIKSIDYRIDRNAVGPVYPRMIGKNLRSEWSLDGSTLTHDHRPSKGTISPDFELLYGPRFQAERRCTIVAPQGCHRHLLSHHFES